MKRGNHPGKTRTSNNPLMITSNQEYRLSLSKLKNPKLLKGQWLEEENKDEDKKAGEFKSRKHDLSFLYSRESDAFGSGVERSESLLARALSENKPLSKVAGYKRASTLRKEFSSTTTLDRTTLSAVEATPDEYKHQAKAENPLYTTTSNQIGNKRPVTYNTMSLSKSQKFSSSFNRMMFQDQGLNTSFANNSVHKSFDSQFV